MKLLRFLLLRLGISITYDVECTDWQGCYRLYTDGFTTLARAEVEVRVHSKTYRPGQTKWRITRIIALQTYYPQRP